MKSQALILLFLSNAVFCARTCWKRPKNPGQKLTSYFRPFARIGRTINLNNDQLGPVLFSEDIIEKNTIREITSSTETKFKVIQTDEDARRMLDISGKLSLQLQMGTAGSVAAQGAGSYLQSMGDRATYAELLLIVGSTRRFEIMQEEEKFLTLEKCKELIKSGDTHLITGFEYGGQCIISVRVKVDTNEKKTQLEGQLSGKLEVTKIKGEISGNLTRTLMEMNKLQNVTIKTFCNANFETVPTNITEAMEVSRNALKLLKMQNSKGVPIKMELTPLTLYKKCRDVPLYRSSTYNDIYLESCAAMMNDARSGMKRLQQCIDNYVLSSTKKATSVKEMVIAAMADMRKADYDMSLSMRDVNGASGVDQFKDFEKLYDAGQGKNPWNYRYWTEYAIILCNSMISFSLPPAEANDLKLSPQAELGFWMLTNVDTTLNGLSPIIKARIPGTDIVCHESIANKAILMLIKDVNVTVIRLEMLIPAHSAMQISLSQIYKSNQKAAFDDENDPSYQFVMKSESSNTGAEVSSYDGYFVIKMDFKGADVSDAAVLKMVPRSSNTVTFCTLKAVAYNHKWMVG